MADITPMQRRMEDMKDKTLGDILRMILAHRRENPTHGTNCACMDFYAWVIAAQIREAIEAPYYDQTDEERKAMWSLSHVLQMTTRKL